MFLNIWECYYLLKNGCINKNSLFLVNIEFNGENQYQQKTKRILLCI